MRIFFIIPLALCLGFCSSCTKDTISSESYAIVVDSIMVTKFYMTDNNGAPWDTNDNPDIRLVLTGNNALIESNIKNNVDSTQSHLFGGLNWQLQEATSGFHYYTLILYDYDSNSTTSDEINRKDNINLTKDGSPLSVISTDGRFEATLYYHH